MNKPVQAMFRVGPSPPEGLFIRALPIYAVAGHISQPVTRCPNHASVEDSSNRGFPDVSVLYRYYYNTISIILKFEIHSFKHYPYITWKLNFIPGF